MKQWMRSTAWGVVVMLAVTLYLGGCGRTEKPAPPPPAAAPVTATLYLPTEDARGVSATTVEVEKTTPEVVLWALLRKEAENPYSVFPRGLRVGHVAVQEGVATVDWTEGDFAQQQGSLEERLAVASIVNTLTTLPGIEAVRFTYQGRPMHVWGHHLDVEKPQHRQQELIVGS